MSAARRKLRRYEGLGHARYLTCSCYGRLPLFQNDSIKRTFVEHLCFVQQEMRFDLHAWVIMPEHVHLLLRPRAEAPRSQPQTVTQILRRIKAPFGRRVIERWRALNAPILHRICDSSGSVRFWLPGGGYDRNIFSDEELIEKINYIHNNPVRRGLVLRPVEYEWSSARYYEGLSYVGPAIVKL